MAGRIVKAANSKRVLTPKRGTHRKIMQLKKHPAKTIAGAIGKGALGVGKKTLRLATRTATTAAGAIAGGTVGLVGGIIAGNGVTGMVAGATAGASFGNKFGGKISQGIEKGASNIATRFQQDRLGEKEYARRQRLEEFQNNDDNWEFARQQAQEKLRATGELGENERPSSKQVQQEMDRMSDYVDKGFTNPEEIARLQRAEQFGYDSKESARAAAYAKKAGYEVNDKTVDQTRNAMIDDFMSTNKNLSQQQAVAMADRQIDILRRQQGYASIKRSSNPTLVKPNEGKTPERGTRSKGKSKAKRNAKREKKYTNEKK